MEKQNTNNIKQRTEPTTIFYLMLLGIIVLAIAIYYSDIFIDPSNQLQYQIGYENATRDIFIQLNNQWVRDLSLYGTTYQPIYANNQTYTMECKITK